MTAPGTIHGIGLGPGAADLMSVRADRLVRAATHVAYFRKAGRAGHARRIVEGLLRPDAVELPMEYPVTTEIPVDDPAYAAALAPFYAAWADRLAAIATHGHDVAVLCEGDPFFYGSFMHLHTRLAGRVPVAVVPGITGMSACWTATGQPVTWGDDALTVLSAVLPEAELAARMCGSEALVVMKLGRNLPKVRRALAAAGLTARAWYIEQGAMPGERALPLSDKADDAAPYFSMIVVHGKGRRP
jgi:precorrin-2/cobalt-factor-2 C20-methyltransferase